MPKLGRPKEKKRKHLHMTVLPSTDKAIRKAIVKSDRALNSVGKVVDVKFGGRGK